MQPTRIEDRPVRSFSRLDLHGLNRWQARKQLVSNLIHLWATHQDFLVVIHGYHHGTVLRDYIRGGRFLRDLRVLYPNLPGIKLASLHEGATKVSFVEVAGS